jgi:hypothetical protein
MRKNSSIHKSSLQIGTSEATVCLLTSATSGWQRQGPNAGTLSTRWRLRGTHVQSPLAYW